MNIQEKTRQDRKPSKPLLGLFYVVRHTKKPENTKTDNKLKINDSPVNWWVLMSWNIYIITKKLVKIQEILTQAPSTRPGHSSLLFIFHPTTLSPKPRAHTPASPGAGGMTAGVTKVWKCPEMPYMTKVWVKWWGNGLSSPRPSFSYPKTFPHNKRYDRNET